MPDDARTVPVTLDVDPNVAAALTDIRTRAAISRVLQPRAGLSELGRAVADAKAEARAVGLADADIDAELDAYNPERRSPPAPRSCPTPPP